jgi:hypothetical protein
VNSFKSVLLAAALALSTVATPASSTAQSPPDDSQAFYLVTLTHPTPTPACNRLKSAMRHPAVARIASACKSFDFTTSDAIYRQRYAAALPPNQAPTVALVRHDGGVLYKASGANIPDGESLAADLTRMAALAQSQDSTVGNQTLLPLRPDGWQAPNLRPNLIPDTVVIQPEINVPESVTSWLMVGMIVLFMLLAGGGAVALCVAVFFFKA